MPSSMPKYQRIRLELKQMAEERATSRDPIPSERDLSVHFGVARMTVRRAIDSLVEEGVLERVVGVGTFVSRPKVDLHARLTSYSEEMQRRGMVPTARVLHFDERSANTVLAREMELTEGEPVIRLQRLLLADGEPMSLDENYLPAKYVPGILDEPPPSSLYNLLEVRYGIVMQWGEDQVEATAATPSEARLLGIDVGMPLMRIQRHAFVGQRLMDYSVSLYRADRYKLWVPLERVRTSTRRPAASRDL
ncbi:GntR family transcriptional regulator [Neomicrococcus lactis]|uniref:GntR family transcriptional regulator n=1 Tax=Neomicrococcus lactis TaxID=732241 RepID=UPI002301D779|nr:GntR family transcriptional regulator [Neomicrococcus lactis]